jgi:hypothetical protein
MVSSAYFRIQAETCFRLARAVKEERIAAELIAMAEDFAARAADLDARMQVRGIARS